MNKLSNYCMHNNLIANLHSRYCSHRFLSSRMDKMREDLWERSLSRANALTWHEVVSYKRTSVTEKGGGGGG